MFTPAQKDIDPVFNIDIEKWKAPKLPGFSACIRVCNDHEWLPEAVRTVISYADEVILALQPSVDDTEKVCKLLADQWPKVKIEYYPTNVYWIDQPEFQVLEVNDIHHPVYMSNWALSKCNYAWTIKMEADVILLDNFSKIIDRVKEADPSKMAYFGWYIFNLAGGTNTHFSDTHPRNHGTDEAIFNTNPYWHFIRHQKWEMVNFMANGNWICTDWGGYHMKRSKTKYMNKPNGETWIKNTKENVQTSLQKYHEKVNPFHGYGNRLGIDELWDLDKMWIRYYTI